MVINDKKNVLILDDEEDMTWSLQKNIPTEDLQINILTASSGEEALSIPEDTKIDLIVTFVSNALKMDSIFFLNNMNKLNSGLCY